MIGSVSVDSIVNSLEMMTKVEFSLFNRFVKSKIDGDNDIDLNGLRLIIRESLEFEIDGINSKRSNAIMVLGIIESFKYYKKMETTINFVISLSDPSKMNRDWLQTGVSLKKLIKSAEEEIIIFGYLLYDRKKEIIPLLKEKIRKNVKVMVYGDLSFLKAFKTAIETKNNVIYFKYLPCQNNYLSHAKFIVVDGLRSLITSANLTEYALSGNFELGLEISGYKVKILRDYIDLMKSENHYSKVEVESI